MRRWRSFQWWYDHHTTNTYRIRGVLRAPWIGAGARPLLAAWRPSPGVSSLEVFALGVPARRSVAAASWTRTEEVSGST